MKEKKEEKRERILELELELGLGLGLGLELGLEFGLSRISTQLKKVGQVKWSEVPIILSPVRLKLDEGIKYLIT